METTLIYGAIVLGMALMILGPLFLLTWLINLLWNAWERRHRKQDG